MSEQPATDAGTTGDRQALFDRLSVEFIAPGASEPCSTRPAGAGVSDDDMADQVGDQTSSDLEAEDVFEREADGAATDTEAAKADGSELA